MNNGSQVFPSCREYERLAARYETVPVWKETAALGKDPIGVFNRLPESDNAFILESVEKGTLTGRYSFLGYGTNETLVFPGMPGEPGGSPLRILRDYFKGMRAPEVEGLPPFFGGAVGYVGYDFAGYTEKIPRAARDDLGMPVFYFMVAGNVIIFDHFNDSVKMVVNTFPASGPRQAYRGAARLLDEIEATLSEPAPPAAPRPPEMAAPVESNFSREDFCRAVEKAKEYIFDGEIFQVVLSQRLKTSLTARPFDVYRTLRKINPSPYMFYLKMGENRLVGSSPETHVKVIGDRITIRPIAGTRKRGADAREDEALEKQLLADEKERAEHLMLVDLARNDAGRVSRTGTVEVDDFMKVFKYSHVMHIESNVTGRLGPGKDRFDVFEASFPAGTVSGAPKIRAMEIIDELEPNRRGPYAGAVGYFSFSGNMDTCITIRTILVRGKDVYVQAGAGIVADSVPEKEYAETVNKAKALMKALEETRRAGTGRGR